jgi:transcriptional regulator PpsR
MDLPPPPNPGALPFRDPSAALGGLEPETTARLLSASGDVTLVLDREGIIRDVAVGSTDFGEDPFAGLLDLPFVDTVTLDSRPKVEEMLRDVASRSTPRWRQVNHPAGAGSVPVRYLALEAGRDGRVIAIGRDMRAAAQLQQRLIQAQQSMERDYARLRQTEQRYRLVFDLSAEPMLIVDAQTRRVTEANPAARALTGGRAALEGQPLTTLFEAAERDEVMAYLGAVGSGANPPPQPLHLHSGRAVQLSATLFRQDRAASLLLRLEGDGVRPAAQAGEALAEVLERIPDAFLLADGDLTIRAVNAAFLDMTHTPRAEQLIGEPLARFLGRPDIDADLLVAELKARGVVRNFETQIRGRHGEREEVELTAVAVERQGKPHYGLAVRSIARRLGREVEDPGMPKSVEQLTELVGRVSLKDIVRESTDLIERLCIEAALRFTANNRASAAEILGLSRQSLYSKLHRHGLGGHGPDLDD